jgi:DNA damage-binding protein 1
MAYLKSYRWILTRRLKEAFNLRLDELQVLDIQFLYECAKPTVCILYQDSKDARHVKTYEIHLKEKEMVEGKWAQPNVETSASIIIPVPSPKGGIIIIGEQTITYHSGGRNSFKSISMKTTVVKSYGKVDEDGSRYLLGDHLGRLYMLILQQNEGAVYDLKLEWLGETSCSSTISYLDNGVVYVGSLYGDSQLIKLNSEKDDSGSYVEITDSFTNLGPIVDLSVVDLERQGQCQVVTCSGAFKDGSLRIIRNGIGINEQATIDLEGLKGLWSLRSSSSEAYHKYLVVSFISETRILSAAGEELEEAIIEGCDSQRQTLFCGNAGDCFLQITEEGVRLIDASTLQLVTEWRAPDGENITVCSANQHQLVVAVRGGKLFYLEIAGKQLVLKGSTTLEHEIACLNITPLGEQRTSHFCAVGMWTDMSIRILALPDLKQTTSESLGGEIIPRSLILFFLEGEN